MKYWDPRPYDEAPPKIQKPSGPPVRIRRWASHGDVIAASCVAKKLHEMGHPVIFETNPECAASLAGMPYISEIATAPGECYVNLDNAYEAHPRRRYEHFHSIFLASAARQLQRRGITIKDFHNVAPELRPQFDTSRGTGAGTTVVVFPRSNSFANKSVPPDVWSDAARYTNFRWIWGGTDPAPRGFGVDGMLKHRDIGSLLSLIEAADLVVSVDTGPLHMAAALKKPIIAIGQSSDPELHLSDQRDFRTIYPSNLDCLNCQEPKCPIADEAPCREIDPDEITSALIDRMGTFVSAIICVYKPSARLDRCIEAALPQVDEIVIALDGDAKVTNKWGPQVKIVPATGKRLGYGRTANRGARNSSGKWLLMLNDDAYLQPDARRRMLIAADTETAAVGCLMRYPDGTIQHGGTIRRPGDRGWGHLDHKKKEPSIAKPVEMEFVCLAAAMVRRSAFFQVDGYDERFDCYSEDADLCLKLRQKGWHIMYTPHAEAIHEDGQTTGDMKHELGKGGRRLLEEKWGWYFDLNRNNEFGRFE